MLRLFVAVELSEEAKEEIRGAISSFSGALSGLRGLRFVSEENWHITLLFLGERDESEIHTIEETMREAAGSLKIPLRIAMRSIGWGPNERNPRMIWANADRPSSKILSDLKERLVAGLRKRGINAGDDKLFKGHVTLARLKDGPRASMPKIGALLHSSFIAHSVFLESSVLTPEGPIYTTLAQIDFQSRF